LGIAAGFGGKAHQRRMFVRFDRYEQLPHRSAKSGRILPLAAEQR